MNKIKSRGFFAVSAFLLAAVSACGSVSQDSPPAGTRAKISIVLPSDISLKSGILQPKDIRLQASRITKIVCEIVGPDMAPMSVDIPIDTLNARVQVPAGPQRLFTARVTTDMGQTFIGTQLVDLAPGSNVDLAISVTIADTPGSPANIQVQIGDGEITLSWDPVTVAESYTVYWNTSGDFTQTNSSTTGITATTYTVTGLTNGTAYYFIVTSVNANGQSSLTGDVLAKPQVIIKGILSDTVSGAAVKPSGGKVMISLWQHLRRNRRKGMERCSP